LICPPTIDLSNSGLEEFQQPEFKGYGVKVNKSVCKNSSNEIKKTPDSPIIEEWVSNSDEDESEVMVSDNVQHKPEQANQPRIMVQKPVVNNVKKGTGQREVRLVWNNAMRINHQNFSNSRRNFAPTVVLTKSGIVPISAARQSSSRAAAPVSAARPINTAAPKPFVNVAKSRPNAFQKSHSLSRRPSYQQTALKNRNLNNKVNTAKVNSINIAKRKRVTNVVGGSHGGKITGKGQIRTRKLDFEDVYFVKELKFNLFYVSQMCDKKNNVLFTETGCLVLSPDYKPLDESQVLLKIPRQNNMYSFDLKDVVPSGDLTCLFAKDGTPDILKNFITGIENQIDHKVKTIRCDNGNEFKNRIMNEFCKMKGRKHALSFMRPFGCPVTILNTIDHLGKFNGKSDDGFFVGYSINSKAFRVFNTRTKIVKENMHINFLKNKSNAAGTGPNRLFDINTLTMSMNYQPVFAGNQTNGNAGTKKNINARQAKKETVPGPQYVLLLFLTSDSQNPMSSEEEVADDAGKKNGVKNPAKEGDMNGPGEATNNNSTNRFNTVSSPVNVVSSFVPTVDPGRIKDLRNKFESVFGQDKDANSTYRMFTPVHTATPSNPDYPTDPLMPDLEDTADP
ncbi:ribonuclease H-like domain-containing protein, partial [Tanacetum coccineum]